MKTELEKYLERSTEPKLVHAGDKSVLLGVMMMPPKVDCRVLAEEYYQALVQRIKELEAELLK